jgi:hypothetical protein
MEDGGNDEQHHFKNRGIAHRPSRLHPERAPDFDTRLF